MMKNKILKFIAQKFPYLGKFKRFLTALIHTISPIKKSYAQHKEDEYIFNLLKYYNIEKAIYVDVGANHPTSISNTYLFYRIGLNGIVIEPNKELIQLHKIFRKKDIPLQVGCSNEPGIFPFYHSKIPVLSSFDYSTFKNHKIQSEKNYWYKEYIPILKLDDIIKHIELNFNFIFLLNIDVEGLDYKVLLGAENTLTNTLFVCIEFNDEEQKKQINDFLENRNFTLMNQISCNLIFKNTDLKFESYIK